MTASRHSSWPAGYTPLSSSPDPRAQLDGLALCRRLKSDPATSDIAVLVFSLLHAERRAQDAGADAFLSKPLTAQSLKDAIRRLLAGPAAEGEGSTSRVLPPVTSTRHIRLNEHGRFSWSNMDQFSRQSLEEIRRTWLLKSDEAVFEALTAGRAGYTEGALRVIADEASRRGLTRPERMKELARAVKAGPMMSPPEQPEGSLGEFFALLVQGLAFLAMMGAAIALRVFLRRLF